MKIAIPLENGTLTQHFGHAPAFAFYSIDPDTKVVTLREDLPAPPHEPGRLPAWLAGRGVSQVLAGGIGKRAINLLAEHNIEIATGASISNPDQLVAEFLSGRFQHAPNQCHHGGRDGRGPKHEHKHEHGHHHHADDDHDHCCEH